MFTPQIDDLKVALTHIGGLDQLIADGVVSQLDDDLVDAVLNEAGRFASEVLAPLNRVGDEQGCSLNPETYDVTTAPGWKEAYQQWCEAGWAAMPCPEEFGGQNMPTLLSLAVQELWNTAASAYGIGTLLTQGAIEAIQHHGTPQLQEQYLANMVSGHWSGTMNLTEPQAGSDLAALKAKAVPVGDGRYKISGTKIFITYGEHDLCDNIIHLVLARLPDAPAGTKGISLFLVPKFLLNDDGTLGLRNDVKCVGLEHKLGIHGSPTCTLQFGDDDGAIGWLIGEENKGLNCMFTMMNNARLHVGMQGVAVAERATQQALAFASERKQGRKQGVDGMVAIIEHADIRRNLLSMKARTGAARAICYACARAMDLSHCAPDQETRDYNHDLCALLTPIAKGFSTDMGLETASDGVQIHGGMGYIEETGAAQHLRDVRITQIYEGTNGIQALDLVGRKLPLRDGKVVQAFIASLVEEAEICVASDNVTLSATGKLISCAIGDLAQSTQWLGEKLHQQDDVALAAATPCLRLFGLVVGAVGLSRMARGTLSSNTPQDQLRLKLAHFYATNHLPETTSLKHIIMDGTDSLIAVTAQNLQAGAG